MLELLNALGPNLISANFVPNGKCRLRQRADLTLSASNPGGVSLVAQRYQWFAGGKVKRSSVGKLTQDLADRGTDPLVAAARAMRA
jgi:hypothetical protein